MARSSPALLGATLAGFVTLGCVTPPSKGDKKPDLSDTTLWTLSSPDVATGGALPASFTCGGSGEHPELAWNAGPEGTQSYALVLKDSSIIERMPDAATMSSAYYWALWNVPAAARQVPRGSSDLTAAPELEGSMQWSKAGDAAYLAPCPNAGAGAPPVTDHFVFTLYALPTPEVEAMLEPGANYAETLDRYLKTVALDEVNLLFTSDAAADASGAGGAGGGDAGGAGGTTGG
jgi:phosphatidylethanolamine-binding protein (PEBP) family uncharacterized protein